MTSKEAIDVLKIEYNKARDDFYKDRQQALEMAINALYRVKNIEEFIEKSKGDRI